MVRIARKPDPRRIAELKKKIHDAEYVKEAIQKLAQRLTNGLIGSRNN